MNIPVKISFTERYGSLLKMAAIGILILLFLIPTAMIKDLIRERQTNQEDVIREIAGTWGMPNLSGDRLFLCPISAKWMMATEDQNS